MSDEQKVVTKRYLEARDIAQVAHDATYRAWFRLGGDKNMVQWDQLSDGVKRNAIDAVSAHMREYQCQQYPTSVVLVYRDFWRIVVRAAVDLKIEQDGERTE